MSPLHANISKTAAQLGLSKKQVLQMLGATQRRERLCQLQSLIAQAQAVADENPYPEMTAGFDAGRWLGVWLYQPQPLLPEGVAPASLMTTANGASLVAQLLAKIAHSALA